MPDMNDHLQKAKWNRDFLLDLIKTTSKYIDWIVVVAFYTALHYIDAKLARDVNFHPGSHSERKQQLSRNFERSTVVNYEKLELACKNARYVPNYTQNLQFTRAKEYADIAIDEFVKKFPQI